jgi:hypothetical protein
LAKVNTVMPTDSSLILPRTYCGHIGTNWDYICIWLQWKQHNDTDKHYPAMCIVVQ